MSLPAFASDDKSAQKPTDPEIAAIVVTANQIDIDAGKLAQTKSTNPEVKKFAERMVEDHTSVNAQASALAQKLNLTPQESETSRSLKKSAEQTMTRLQSLEGAAFDRAYVDNEVAYHQAVIGVMDKQLVPGAKNAELKKLLVQSGPAFTAHLKHAQQLQKSLSGQQGTGGSGEEGTKQHH
jgi:putative membrane protein